MTKRSLIVVWAWLGGLTAIGQSHRVELKFICESSDGRGFPVIHVREHVSNAPYEFRLNESKELEFEQPQSSVTVQVDVDGYCIDRIDGCCVLIKETKLFVIRLAAVPGELTIVLMQDRRSRRNDHRHNSEPPASSNNKQVAPSSAGGAPSPNLSASLVAPDSTRSGAWQVEDGARRKEVEALRQRFNADARWRLNGGPENFHETPISLEMKRLGKTDKLKAGEFAFARREEIVSDYAQRLSDARTLARDVLMPLLEAAELSTHRPDYAIEQFNRLIALDPSWAEARSALFHFLTDRLITADSMGDGLTVLRYARQGRFVADAAVAAIPGDVYTRHDQLKARANLARAEWRYGNLDSAIVGHHEALAICDSLPEGLRMSTDERAHRAEILLSLASILNAAGRMDSAKVEGESASGILEEVLVELPKDSSILATAASAQELLAQCAWEEDDYKSARQYFERAHKYHARRVKCSQKKGQAWWGMLYNQASLGELASANSEWKEASTHFRKALALVDSMESCKSCGSMAMERWWRHLRLGQVSLAQEDLQTAQLELSAAFQIAKAIHDTTVEAGSKWNFGKSHIEYARLLLAQQDTTRSYHFLYAGLSLQESWISATPLLLDSFYQEYHNNRLWAASSAGYQEDPTGQEAHLAEAQWAADTLLHRWPENVAYRKQAAWVRQERIISAGDNSANALKKKLLDDYTVFAEAYLDSNNVASSFGNYSLGILAEDERRWEDALRYYTLDRDFWRRAADCNSTNNYARKQAAWSSLDLARIAGRAGNEQAAGAHASDALRAAEYLVEQGIKEQETLELFSDATMRFVNGQLNLNRNPKQKALSALLFAPRAELVDYRAANDSLPGALQSRLKSIDVLIRELDLPTDQYRLLLRVRELESRATAHFREPVTRAMVADKKAALHWLEEKLGEMDPLVSSEAEEAIFLFKLYLPWNCLQIREPIAAEQYALEVLKEDPDSWYFKATRIIALAYQGRGDEARALLPEWNGQFGLILAQMRFLRDQKYYHTEATKIWTELGGE